MTTYKIRRRKASFSWNPFEYLVVIGGKHFIWNSDDDDDENEFDARDIATEMDGTTAALYVAFFVMCNGGSSKKYEYESI